VVAWVCVGISAINVIWLWYGWNKNHVWIVNHIVISGVLISLVSMLSALADVYGAEGSTNSGTTKSIVVVTLVIALICAVLFIAYRGIFLRSGLKERDDQAVTEQFVGKDDE
ncbi:hypothetical protein HYDPIDRAFT_64135, partial [Hydnomerulius pinastri MD-312]